MDPSNPSAPTINLAITTRRADGASWASPILVLNGMAPNYGSADPRRSTEFIGHDLVFIDQRGIGRSDGAVTCTGLDKYTAERNTTLLGPEAVAAFKACLATLTAGPIPIQSIFDHDVVASDIGVVRRALGIDRWSVDASNGGVDIVLRMVAGDPGTVSSIVARSPQIVGVGESPNTMADGFDRFAADCAAAPACSANGDLKELEATALARLAIPVTTKTVEDGTGLPVVLDTLAIQGGLPDGMGDPNIAPALPGLIKGLADGSADEAVAAFYKTYNSGGPTSSPLDIVDDCQNNDYLHPGIQHSAADHGGLFTGWSLKRYCDLIGPVPQYPSVPNVTSEVPVLAVVSAYDVLSSESNANAIFAGFTNTTVVVVPGISNVYSQLHDCWVASLAAFVDNPKGPIDTTCLTSPVVTTFK